MKSDFYTFYFTFPLSTFSGTGGDGGGQGGDQDSNLERDGSQIGGDKLPMKIVDKTLTFKSEVTIKKCSIKDECMYACMHAPFC